MKISVLDAPVRKNLIFVLPGLILYGAFVLGPIVAAVVISFTRWNGLSLPSFVGFGNYIELFSDSRFFTALKNNAVLMLFYCLAPLALGIVLAAIIRSIKTREQLALRTLLFMPYIMPSAVLGIIWQWLYNPAFGPINQGLKIIGLGAIALPWLGDFTFALPAVGAVAAWYYFGFCMVIFLTGLQRIDPSLFEAARVDGASPFTIFRRITLPLLLPEIRVVLLLTIIASIKSFDLVFTMTRGGPANATLVPNIYMYELGFHLNRYGYAAAVAIIGAIIIFIVNYAVHRFVRPQTEGAR
ncbi:sugar ABC transporter permease [Allorhizobium sp. BGMRC 0089]|uniref:carbohydrate ABC transporter permease n=1 Tax=Allorhizobium sonneratiae TaxID=2934936 RepID=UPI002034402C|nr:sugar ABC transporter permease [Allorhizobium sonneratiae]MCM2293103.1 sugar ABC transporter permease [Allorhizobium sonneratiae]